VTGFAKPVDTVSSNSVDSALGLKFGLAEILRLPRALAGTESGVVNHSEEAADQPGAGKGESAEGRGWRCPGCINRTLGSNPAGLLS
jgi:hypothetical protein